MTLGIPLGLSLLVALTQGGRDPNDPTRAVPAGSFACVQFAGLAACRGSADELGMLALAERLVAKVEERLGDRFLPRDAVDAFDEVDRRLREIGLDRATIRQVLQGGVAFGVGRPTAFGDAMLPSMALVIDIEGREAAARKVAKTLAGILVETGPDIEVVHEDLGGDPIEILRPKRHNGAVAWCIAPPFLIATNSPGYLRDCLRALRGEAPSLAADPGLARASDRLGPGALLSMSANTRVLGDWIGRFLPYEAEGLLDALGIDGCDGVLLGIGAERGSSVGVLHVGVTSRDDSPLLRATMAPSPNRAIDLCPADTLAFLSLTLDPQVLHDVVGRIVQALPNEARRELARGLHQAPFDHDRVKELIESLGPRISVAMPMPGTRSIVPELLAFVDVRGQADVQGQLARLCADLGVELTTARFQDREIHYVSVQDDGMRFSPSFVVHDGMLVLGSDLRGVKAALAREKGDSLAASPSFATTLGDVRSSCCVFALRLGDNVAKIWDMVEPRLEGVLWRSDDIPVGIDDLPTVDELRTAFADVVCTARMDQHGITLRAQSPIGFGALLATCGKWLDKLLELEELPKKAARRKIY
jgi:hypothetical protein